MGRSELAAVESHLELILGHLIKLVFEPDAPAVPHWRGEIVGFHSGAKRRYSPSMRQRIDMRDLWRSAREQAIIAYEGAPRVCAFAARLPEEPVIGFDDPGARIDPVALVERLRLSLALG